MNPEILVKNKEAKVESRYIIWPTKIDTSFQHRRLKGKNVFEYARPALDKLIKTGKRSAEFTVPATLLGDPEVSEDVIKIKALTCDRPDCRETWNINLDPKSVARKASKGHLDLKLTFGIKRLELKT